MEWIKENFGEEIIFLVIVDDCGEFVDKFGMIFSGVIIIVRVVFIVDDKGIIRVIVYYLVEVGRDWDEIFRFVKVFKVSDEKGVVFLYKWLNNEFIGDKVIVLFVSIVDEVK